MVFLGYLTTEDWLRILSMSPCAKDDNTGRDLNNSRSAPDFAQKRIREDISESLGLLVI